ncbi:MAG: hypothetical protein AAFQ68_10445 [Bacteroidota bacterium]
MADTNPYIAQIDAYLRRELSPEQTEAFEAALAQDTELEAAVKAHLEALVAIRQRGFQEEIEAAEIEKPVPQIEESRIRSIRPLWYVAAAVVLLFAIGWWLLPASQNDGDRLFAEYFHAPVALDLIRGEAQSPADSLPTPLVQGLQAYQREGYEEAIKRFKETNGNALTAAERSWIQFLTGLSFLANSEADSALHYLAQAEGQTEAAEWYQALALLRKGAFAEAKKKLQTISEQPKHAYHALAVELLGELK